MFRVLARHTSPDQVFLYHPSQLSHYLETIWALRSPGFAVGRSSPPRPEPVLRGNPLPQLPAPSPSTEWHHLIYAYMMESTAIVQIFERVLTEVLNSERCGILSHESHMWVRNTEELFYRESPPFAIYAVTSQLRPDLEAVRKNAYYRMFGLDLPSGASGDSNYIKPESSNLEFISTLEEFLREAWIGIENVQNTSGANPTDNQAVANLARRLSDMLRDRRQNGNLSREEFFVVAMMSWFHLTVEFNSPIVVDLRADGTSPEERLKRIGDKVMLPAHPKSDSYFQIAEAMSALLTVIENQGLNQPVNVPVLFAPGSYLRGALERIIAHWSIISGKMLKATKVAVSPK